MVVPVFSARRRRTLVTMGVALALVLPVGCGGDDGADSADPAAAAEEITSRVTALDQIPDPCTLVARESLSALITDLDPLQRNPPAFENGEPLLFRTCAWGNPDDPEAGAIGVQIGVPTASGHDVVFNRSTVLDPALSSSLGEDGKEAMFVGEMPTGGAKGSTIFLRHRGWSILIGHVGVTARLSTVQGLAVEVMALLDSLPAADA
jgi:hypothetical protein